MGSSNSTAATSPIGSVTPVAGGKPTTPRHSNASVSAVEFCPAAPVPVPPTPTSPVLTKSTLSPLPLLLATTIGDPVVGRIDSRKAFAATKQTKAASAIDVIKGFGASFAGGRTKKKGPKMNIPIPVQKPVVVDHSEQAALFRKEHLESEMAAKESGVDEETKNMFKAAYDQLKGVGGGVAGGELTKEAIRQLFSNLEDSAFEDIYSLFDWDNDGSVDKHEFVLTMSLLATPATSFEGEQDLLWAIFDGDGSGSMDREEFGRMMRATLRCKMTHLDFCMKNEGRKQHFLKHLEGEFSTETLEFYNAVEDFRETLLTKDMVPRDDAPTTPIINATAVEIFDKYVKAGSDREVNIPGKMMKVIEKLIKEVRVGGAGVDKPVDATVFDDAQAEIYHLMNRDTFERFKNDDVALKGMLDTLFTEVDVDKTGIITIVMYKKWATKNPELTNFLKDLHTQTLGSVNKAAGVEKLKVRRASAALSPKAKAASLSETEARNLLAGAADGAGFLELGIRYASNPNLNGGSQVTNVVDIDSVVRSPICQGVDHRPSNPKLMNSAAVNSFRGVSNKAMSGRNLGVENSGSLA